MKTRRSLTALTTVLLWAIASLEAASGQNTAANHALALHGMPKYGAGFEHLDYVNADPPKGGEVRLAETISGHYLLIVDRGKLPAEGGTLRIKLREKKGRRLVSDRFLIEAAE